MYGGLNENGSMRIYLACFSCNMCYRTPAHKCIFRLMGIE